MKDLFVSLALYAASFVCFFLALVIIFMETRPNTYGVYYEFLGQKGYSTVQGSPTEIIDELNSRKIYVHDIIPIR